MTDPIIGRKGLVALGGATIANLANFRIDFSTDDLDGSVFGTGWGATLPGQQKWKATVGGFLDMTDTTGQLALKIAKFAGTKVTNIRFYESGGGSFWGPDITEDSGAGAYVGTMAIDEAQNGLVKVDYSFGGVGPIDRF
jgi:hypothetical protein